MMKRLIGLTLIPILIITLFMIIRFLSQVNIVTPTHPLYIVAMIPRPSQDGTNNVLVTLNADTFEETNRTRLLDGMMIRKLNRDPLGRIWIGYGWVPKNYTNQVDIFQPNGQLLKSMELCGSLNVDIPFVNGYAFVPCFQNGPHPELIVVDLESLEIVKHVGLIDDPRFSFQAAATNGETILVVGNNETDAITLLIDTKSLEINKLVSPDDGSRIFTVLVHNKQFYLLNQRSGVRPIPPVDLRIVKTGDAPTITEHNLAERSPYLGLIVENFLFTYHWLPEFASGEKRTISRTDLTTFESKSWPLPDYWNAGAIFMLNGKVTLTGRNTTNQAEESGLHTFDFETGKLTKILDLPGARLAMTGE